MNLLPRRKLRGGWGPSSDPGLRALVPGSEDGPSHPDAIDRAHENLLIRTTPSPREGRGEGLRHEDGPAVPRSRDAAVSLVSLHPVSLAARRSSWAPPLPLTLA